MRITEREWNLPRMCLKTGIRRVAGVPPAHGETILASLLPAAGIGHGIREQDVRDTSLYTL